MITVFKFFNKSNFVNGLRCHCDNSSITTDILKHELLSFGCNVNELEKANGCADNHNMGCSLPTSCNSGFAMCAKVEKNNLPFAKDCVFSREPIKVSQRLL